jgi:hypothetical protein
MNCNALVAALGADARTAVDGYRLEVISEGERRGLCLVNEPIPDPAERSADRVASRDPLEIQLIVIKVPTGSQLLGSLLRWNPADGWSLASATGRPSVSYFAGRDATPLDLVPNAAELLSRAVDGVTGPPWPPERVELDADLTAIRRLLTFINPRCTTDREARTDDAPTILGRAATTSCSYLNRPHGLHEGNPTCSDLSSFSSSHGSPSPLLALSSRGFSG